MSVKQRGKTWQVYVKVGKRRIRQTARTRAEGRELEASLRADLKAAPRRGLEEALAEYFRSEAKTLRDQKGLKTNAKALRPYLVGRTLEDAPMAASDARKAWLAVGLLPATINRRLALLRRLLNLCFEWGWTDFPLGKRIKLLSGENERHIYLSAEQVEEIASRMPLAGDMVRLTAYTGLRLGECMALTQANVSGTALVLTRTKNDKPRIIPVPERVQHILKRVPWQITETVRRKEWEAARGSCGIDGVRWHDLRHTFASFLAAKGASDRELSELMGHLSAQMVRRYAHLKKEHLAKLVSNL